MQISPFSAFTFTMLSKMHLLSCMDHYGYNKRLHMSILIYSMMKLQKSTYLLIKMHKIAFVIDEATEYWVVDETTKYWFDCWWNYRILIWPLIKLKKVGFPARSLVCWTIVLFPQRINVTVLFQTVQKPSFHKVY